LKITLGFWVVVLLAAGRLAAASYTLTDLGSATNGPFTAINASGEVAWTSASFDAMLYNGSYTIDLGSLAGGAADGINSSGEVTGDTRTGGTIQAFLYNGTSIVGLGTLGGSSSSIGYGVNDSGEVTGAAGPPNQTFLYNGTSMVNLGTLPGFGDNDGQAINNSGEVAGYARAPDGVAHAFLWNGTSWVDLGNLGGDAFGYAINASGEVAGVSSTSGSFNSGNERAFLYNGTTMINLGTLSGDQTVGQGINDSGEVVGYYCDAATCTSGGAFLYNGVSMISLNAFVDSPGSDFTHFLQATGINDAGQIVGDGLTTSGQEDAFLLTPTDESTSVPEPSTLLLLGTGLAAVARRLRPR